MVTLSIAISSMAQSAILQPPQHSQQQHWLGTVLLLAAFPSQHSLFQLAQLKHYTQTMNLAGLSVLPIAACFVSLLYYMLELMLLPIHIALYTNLQPMHAEMH